MHKCMPIVPENKALFYLYIMCIFVLIFNKQRYNNDKDFIFPHFGLNIHHTFLYFVTLKLFVFVIGKLFWLHCSDKIVKST